jgi:hypothetical protein
VIASVGADREGNSYNINADEAAGAVARALGAYKVMFLTDVAGWLRDPADPGEPDLRGDRREVRAALPGVAAACARSSQACLEAIDGGVSARPHRRRARRRTRCCSSCSPTPARARRSADGVPVSLAELQELERSYAIPTYARNPVEFVRGEGCAPVGRRGQRVPRLPRRDLGAQRRPLPSARGRGGPRAGGRLMHVSNLYYTEPAMRLASGACPRARSAARCSSATPAPRPTRRRSSSRARPARAARSWCSTAPSTGRTYGALSATPQESKQAPFAPLVPGLRGRRPRTRGARAAVDERHRGGAARADPGRERRARALRRAAARRARGLRPGTARADLRRDPDRDGAHRDAVGLRADRRRARRDDERQGARRRAADRRAHHRRAAGRRLPARRPRLDLRRRPGRLRRRAGRARDLLDDPALLAACASSASGWRARPRGELPHVVSVRGRRLAHPWTTPNSHRAPPPTRPIPPRSTACCCSTAAAWTRA